jgi:hypothetical protein
MPSTIRTVRQRKNFRSKITGLLQERAFLWCCDHGGPALFEYGGQQIEKTMLAAAEGSELVEEQQPHRRGIAARTKK